LTAVLAGRIEDHPGEGKKISPPPQVLAQESNPLCGSEVDCSRPAPGFHPHFDRAFCVAALVHVGVHLSGGAAIYRAVSVSSGFLFNPGQSNFRSHPNAASAWFQSVVAFFIFRVFLRCLLDPVQGFIHLAGAPQLMQ
jgi:hypothetical protein